MVPGTSIIALVKTLLQAFIAYLELRNKTFYYTIYRLSKEKQTKLISEIETLRNNRDSSSTDRADFLQNELIAEKRDLEHLSTFYTNFKPGSDNPDEGGVV